MVLKRKQPDDNNEYPLFRSERIEDRDSIFVAQYSPTETAKLLQAQPDFKDASHRIVAWRKPSKQKALFGTGPAHFDTGFDDDGERYAGRKVAKVLEDMDMIGAVVVARWYGGTLLGPVRFTHIEKCARDAIIQYKKYLAQQDNEANAAVAEKKRKTDREDRQRLLRELPQRDANILALRSLLAQKRDATASSPAPASQNTPSKGLDYMKMPVETLKKLEQARDRTISFLLKSIDEIEAKFSEAQPSDTTVDEPSAKEKTDGKAEGHEGSIKENPNKEEITKEPG